MFLGREEDKAIIIVVAIIEKEGKLLMVQEGREDVRGLWNLPAGHINFGEDPLKAVVREAKEETGLDVEPKSLSGIYAFKDKETSLPVLRFHFKCEIKGGKFEDQEGEMLDIKYMSEKELLILMKSNKLRGTKTRWSIQDWIDGVEYPLNLIKIIEGVF